MSNRSDQYDVIIAGTSYSGLTMAIALATAFADEAKVGVIGADVATFDVAADPRAFALSAASKALLDALGIWSRVAELAEPVLEIEITDSPLEAGVRPSLLTYDNVLDDGEPASFIVPGAALGNAIASRLGDLDGASLDVVTPARVERFSIDGARAVLELNSGGTATASLAIAADGRDSLLRKEAGIDIVGWPHDQIGIVTTVAHERPHNGRAVQHFLPAGPFAILPLTGSRSCLTWSEKSESAHRILALSDAEFLDEVDMRFGGKLGDIRLDGPRRSFPLATHVARRFVGERLALLGDAAHSVHPIAGQGLNLAFRDIAALVECLVDGVRVGLDWGDLTILERYERWRRFDSATSAGAFDGINRLFAADWSLLRSAREVGLGTINQLPGMKAMIVKEAAGLTGELPRLLRGEPL